MSFPNVIYGNYGDEKVAQSTKIGGLPLGQIMVLPDGRTFAHARAGTAALMPGKIVQAGSAVPDHGCGTADQLAATVIAVAATSVTLTAGGTTAVTADQYAGGEMFIRDGALTEGHVYKIKANSAAAASTAFVVSLEPTDGLKVALVAATLVGLRTNPHREVITRPTGTALVGPVIGVPVLAVSAGFYTWLQKKGIGGALFSATSGVIGEAVMASTAIAGAIHPIDVTASTVESGLYKFNSAPQTVHILGAVHAVSDDTEYGLVNWNIP